MMIYHRGLGAPRIYECSVQQLPGIPQLPGVPGPGPGTTQDSNVDSL